MASNFLLYLPENSDKSLQAQIRETIVSAILDGHIPPGSHLPSGRKLAEQLGVARNTVVLAYQQLVDEGYLLAKQRSGYYVCDDILEGKVQVSAPVVQERDDIGWYERLVATPSEQRYDTKPLDWQDYEYPFIRGQFDPSLFPIADWRQSTRQSLAVQTIRYWAKDSVDSDDPLLVEQLRKRVLPRRGVWANPDEILVTMGTQQALYLLGRLLIGAHTEVGLEDPGYPDARNIFSLITDRLVGLPVDGEGLKVSDNLMRCRLIYTTPSHHYPTNVIMSLARRKQILASAADNDSVIIEDDYEVETNYVENPTPALKSLDSDGRVIYIGSMSKTLAPGLRMGYLVAPAPLIREARAMRRLMMRHPPANNQRTLAVFLAEGHHDSLSRRLNHAYRDRWEVMAEALDRYLPSMTYTPTRGGTSYWIRGDASLNCRSLDEAARQQSILIEPGDTRFLSENPPMNYFSLGFSSIGVDKIDPGVRALAEIVKEQQDSA
ncbi:MAG: PLP-dependent aminotransferase family protein [Pseudomonadota bacterium]